MNILPLRLLLATLAVFVLAAMPRLTAQSVPATADSTINIVSYLKLAPPQQLAQDIMGVARQVYPGMQTEMLPLMALGRYGYPTFPGVSTQYPVTIFVFNGPGLGGGTGVVIAAQITPDSPVRSALASLRLAMQTDSATGWTFLSPNPALLSLAMATASDLVKIASQTTNVDLQLTTPTTDLTFLRSTVQTALQTQAATAGGIPAGSQKWFDFGLQEMQALTQVQVGVDCKPDAIRLTFSATAQPGTALAQVFSAPAGGPVPAAQFVTADAPILVVSHEDIPSIQAYLNHVFSDAQNIAGVNGKLLLASVQKALDGYLSLADGTVAEALSMTGTSDVHAQIVAGGNVTDAAVVSFLQQMYPDFASNLLQRVDSANGNLMQSNVTLNLDAGKVSGTPFHEVNMQQALNPAFVPSTAAKKAALQAFTQNGTRTVQNNDMYFAAVNGYYISSSSAESLANLTQAVQSGQPVPNNLASLFTLSPGEMMAGQVNLGQVVANVMSTMNSVSGAPNSSADAQAALRSANLQPITFSATTGANQVQFQIAIPVSSIVQTIHLSQPPPPPPPVNNSAPAPSPSSGAAPSTLPPPQSVVTPTAPASTGASN
ncbi:MAG: hypothetical protein ABSH19_06395 [Opitutales bacterium]